ncbi:MAG TPA: peptidylprolyl isomerase [Bacteroidia bacterium]|nr:peptidylprolyl isomerase [Bacteroidia bacterium]
MAIISQIRKRGTIIVGFVGLSLLLFILGDVVTSNSGLFQSTSDVMGVIGGEKIHYREFEMRVENMIENYKLNTKQEQVDANTSDMIREQLWNTVVTENTSGKEIEKLGISCDNDELYDLVAGKNVDDKIKQAFRDSLGNFSTQNVVKFLNNLPNAEEKLQKQWAEFEKALQDERRALKYKELVKGSLYVTTNEARRNFSEQNGSVSIQYVADYYRNIADSTVTVTDSEIEKYYNEHKNDYKQAESMRKVDYVTFDVVPSEEDRQNADEWIRNKMDEFKSTDDNAAFIARYSDSPLDSSFHSQSALAPGLQNNFSGSVGTVIGPYDDGASRKLAKISAERTMPDSVKARHILLKIENGDTAKILARADSMKKAARGKGKVFEEMAQNFSQDPGSGIKGGDLGWFKQGMMVPEFNAACFNGKKGDMPIVTSQFGVHLIEITDQAKPSRQIQVAVLDHKVEPSQKTYDSFYQKASEFSNKNNTGELFDKACTDQGLNKRIADNLRETEKSIAGLEQPRELVRWAYTAKKGDVSKAFTFGDKYVVAHLSGIKDKGTLPLDEVREQVTTLAKKEKKAEMLIEKFSKAMGSPPKDGLAGASGKTIEAIGQQLNLPVQTNEGILFSNAVVQNLGREMGIVGTLFVTEEGKMTAPLKGESVVMIALVTKVNLAAKDSDVKSTQQQLLTSIKQRSEYEVQNALKEKAKIEDNRGKFY